MASPNEILVEVAYARPDKQVIVPLKVKPDTTVKAAIDYSGILNLFSEIDLEKNKVGIFGKITALDTVLREGDRIEIYRPLIADPKQIRRQRAAQGKQMKKGKKQ